MSTATITKTLLKVESITENYSIGFKRLVCLPKRVRLNINTACVLKGYSSDEPMKNFLSELTEQEFVEWMKIQ